MSAESEERRPCCFEHFAQRAAESGASVRRIGPEVWRITGIVAVDYWPWNEEPLARVVGMSKPNDVRDCPPDRVIQIAITLPPVLSRRDKRRRASGQSSPGRASRLLMLDPHCFWCGVDLVANRMQPTRDHVIPVSRGGSNGTENVVLACVPCNTRRGNDLTPDDVKAVLAAQEKMSRYASTARPKARKWKRRHSRFDLRCYRDN